MNKRIIIGSVLVLTLLLLMPSISAIQFKTFKNKIQNDFFTQKQNADLIDSKSIILEEIPDHPILFFWVMFSFHFRLSRAEFFMRISSKMDEDLNLQVSHLFLWFWSIILIYGTLTISDFWWDLAEENEWNWGDFL